MIKRRELLVGALAGATAAGRALAQPALRTPRMLVGFAPGGALDLVARVLVEKLKVPGDGMTIVDNRPGAGGRLALEILKGAAPDGLTVGISPGDQLTLFPNIYNRLGYEPLRDFAPISTVCRLSFALAIGPQVPAEVATVSDFMDWCRAHPNKANFGSPGEVTRQHFMGAALARVANVDLVHLPYKGASAAVQDLLAGQVAATVGVLSNFLPYARSGRLRVLLVSAPQRSMLLPATPTAREAGYEAFEGEEWFGVFAPASTSSEVIDAWNKGIRTALESSVVIESLSKQAFQPAASTPQELQEMVRQDIARWNRQVREAKFTPSD